MPGSPAAAPMSNAARDGHRREAEDAEQDGAKTAGDHRTVPSSSGRELVGGVDA